ncbi:SULTR4 [Symbiodinium sp. CCMP2592]|nr:SULTR4 [Symbiodinium sp. CCMP2592]
MLALGISNLVGAAFSCYPVTGSFSRSAVNNSTGAQTQLSGVITAIVMLCTLLFLTPLFYYLPKFALAAIVMNSVIPLVALGEAKHLFHVKKHDFLLWVTAFLGTLFLGVLMGILVAVGLSLIIVIYESARPQITILWRIPGTSIYRNMKQESSGTFIQNVFIARIGSSLYFANASFVKDMLLAHVSDLDIVNKTEYIVLEMTPVISVDSSACHVIKDVVNDFRMRNMQVAFAMVGNRVDKTLRKAGLKKFIGDQWFFPTVEEAVQYCVKHQHARRVQDERSSRAASGMLTEEEKQGTAGPIDISTIQVHTGNEIGFSNDLHSSCTMVFISLVKDVPMIMSEIANVFKKNQVSIIRAQIDPSNDESGAKHIYFVRSIRTDNKLTVLEISRIREDLEVVLRRHQLINSKASGETFEVISPSHGSISNEDIQLQHSAGTDRLSRLEEAECGEFGLWPGASQKPHFEVTKQFRVLYQGAPFPRRAEALQRRGPTLTVLAAAAVPAVTSCSSLPLRRARRWPTGHVVRLRHLETKHSFEFIVERRSHAVLLSSPLAPFERVALPPVLPEIGVGPDILDLNVARASGNDKDWPLFWCVSSWDSDGCLCLEISNARRPDLVLSASLEGQLVLQRRPMSPGRTASSTFIEVFCQENLNVAAAASATPLRRSESTGDEVQSLAPSGRLLPEDLRSFARNGYVVVKKAVPDFLWRPACALVHSQIGSQGMIQGGDTSNSGFESVGKLQGKTPHRPQFRDLLLHPSSAAGSCAAQMLGWRSISAVLKGRQLPAQVALRFPDAILAEEKATSWAAPLQLGDLLWHTDGCGTRQCSRHPFSLLVGVALTDSPHGEQLCGNLCERLLIAAKAPQVVRDLPAALRVQETVQFDVSKYNLREQISSLLVGADVGHFSNEQKALEDFEAIPSIFRSFPARQRLCEVLTQASEFLAVYERLVLEVLVPWLRQRLEKQVGTLGPTTFSYQYPPTLRIQPGRSEEFKRPHRDAEYGHQIGELNFWMPLTDYNMTQATLWVESSPGAEDFQPLAINHGSIAVFHGTLCRHKVPANTSPFTRVSLDFRIGFGDFFDRDWQLDGVKHIHSRREVVQ